MHNTKLYSVRDGKILSIYSALLHDLDSQVTKAAKNYFELSLTTLDGMNSYRTYMFSMSDLEAHFDLKTNELLSITLRDTAVHKKIEFYGEKATLVFARGKDVVGLNSELNDLTTKEIIHDIILDGSKFEAPYNIKEIYLVLTGVDLDKEEVSAEELEATNVWFNFLQSSE